MRVVGPTLSTMALFELLIQLRPKLILVMVSGGNGFGLARFVRYQGIEEKSSRPNECP